MKKFLSTLILVLLLMNIGFSQGEVLLHEYKFETNQEGWALTAYTSTGSATTTPTSSWISGVNWPTQGGSAGCVRHNIATGSGAWMARSPAISLDPSFQYFVRFGVTMSAYTASYNCRVQVRVNSSTAFLGATILLPSTTLPSSAVGAAGYTEYTSSTNFSPPSAGNYYFFVGDFFTGGSNAVYYDRIQILRVSGLPVTLTDFSVSCEGERIVLNWETASEFNASHYDLQESRDGVSWISLGIVEAAGTTTLPSQYSFEVNGVESQSYYRLVQTDFDGVFEIFGPISHQCGLFENDVSLFPNPVVNKSNLSIHSNKTYLLTSVSVLDLEGKIIQSFSIDIMEGTNLFPLELDKLRGGVYLLRFDDLFGVFESIQFVKQ